jgi:MSHA biogenesis protein MshI
MMRWPWARRSAGQQLVVSWSRGQLAYVVAQPLDGGRFEVLKHGVQEQGADSPEDFVRRLQGLGLKGLETRIMLRPEQYQLLQIDAPAVAPEELRAAARYQIKELLDTHVDDVTLDVMRVGDGQQKSAGQLFVVAAANSLLRGVLDLAAQMHWTVQVIDIQDNAQRNLQTLLASQDGGRTDRATAALVMADSGQALLTISASEELFYSRRLDLPDGFFDGGWRQEDGEEDPFASSFTPVQEYVPDYSVGGASHGADYSRPAHGLDDAASAGWGEGEKAQRFVVEVQRSLDVWSRTWSTMPLYGVRVFAGTRSAEMAAWLEPRLGHTVMSMDFGDFFPGFDGGELGSTAFCMPLLGVFLRSETRKL